MSFLLGKGQGGLAGLARTKENSRGKLVQKFSQALLGKSFIHQCILSILWKNCIDKHLFEQKTFVCSLRCSNGSLGPDRLDLKGQRLSQKLIEITQIAAALVTMNELL